MKYQIQCEAGGPVFVMTCMECGSIELEARSEGGDAYALSNDTTGWQPIETAPRDGTPVDLWVNHDREQFRVVGAHWVSGRWLCEHRGSRYELWPDSSSPTHWMPLPEPPE